MISFTQPINNEVYGYVRVSTVSQNSPDKVSLDVQEIAIRQYCSENNLILKKIFKEIGSAYQFNDYKRQIHKNIKNLKNTQLIVYDISRLSRNYTYKQSSYFLLDFLLEKNIKITTLQPSPKLLNQIELIRGVEDAENTSTMLGIKVKAGLQRRKDKGLFTGSVEPFGWSKVRLVSGNGLVPNKSEVAIQKFIWICKNNRVYSKLLNKLMLEMLKCQYKACVYCNLKGWILVTDYTITKESIYCISTDYGTAMINEICPVEKILEECPIICGKTDSKYWTFMTKVKLDNREIVNLLNDYGIKKRGKKFTVSNIRNCLDKLVESYHLDEMDIGEEMESLDLNDRTIPIKDVYEIEDILDTKIVRNREKFLIKWKGWGKKHNSWVDERDIIDKQLILDFKSLRFNEDTSEDYEEEEKYEGEEDEDNLINKKKLVQAFIKYCRRLNIQKSVREALDIMENVNWELDVALDKVL